MNLEIDPVLFHAGAFEFRWYTLLLIISGIVAFILLLLEARRLGIKQAYAVPLFFWEVVFKLIFAKIFLYIDRWNIAMEDPAGFWSLSLGRLDGAIIGSLIMIFLFAKITRLPFWKLCDLMTPCIAVAIAIGRVGCTINGCCYGLPCDLPWAVTYVSPDSRAPVDVPLHPVQIYQVIWYAGVFVVIWLLRKKLKPVGSLYLLFLILHAAGDSVTRIFRSDNQFLLGMQQAQVVNIIMLLICVPAFFIRRRRYQLANKSATIKSTLP